MLRERRALVGPLAKLLERARIVEAAEHGPVVQRLAGTDRTMPYRTALRMAFRASKLRSLSPAALDLEGEHPTVALNMRTSKRRRADVQPITPNLAEGLRDWMRGEPADAPRTSTPCQPSASRC